MVARGLRIGYCWRFDHGLWLSWPRRHRAKDRIMLPGAGQPGMMFTVGQVDLHPGQTHLKIFRKQCVMMAKIEDHMI
jgi:hypothetical protein